MRGADALANESARSGEDLRRDQGSGPALEFRYQLNVEDAYTIRDFDLVVFADAAGVGDGGAGSISQGGTPSAGERRATTGDVHEGVALTEIGPSAMIAFTTHEMSPASVLALCHELYGRTPRAYVLAIRGREWDLGEGLSEEGRTNLARAVEMLRRFLEAL
jgi:hydrogenase maturation protease